MNNKQVWDEGDYYCIRIREKDGTSRWLQVDYEYVTIPSKSGGERMIETCKMRSFGDWRWRTRFISRAQALAELWKERYSSENRSEESGMSGLKFTLIHVRRSPK